MRRRVVALVALLVPILVLNGPVQGGVVGVSTGSAQFVVPAAGTSLKDDQFESQLVRVFNERGNVAVAGLAVDTRVSLLAPGVFTLAANGPNGTPGTLTGTFNSYFLHFDAAGDPETPTIDVLTAPGTPAPFNTADGFVTFDESIAGLIFSTQQLNATDATFGRAGIIYPSMAPVDGSARGLDVHNSLEDNLWLSADRKTLFYNWRVFGAYDEVRVLTTPEPTGLVLAGLGVAGLVLARRRRAS